MFSGDWRKLIAPIALITIASSLTMLVGWKTEPKCLAKTLAWESDSDPEHNQSRSYGSRSVTCHANCQVHFGFEGRKADSDSQNPESEDNGANDSSLPPVDERDLCQQSTMAHWTRIIALWTAIGAMLLFWTLLLTRRDIEATRQIGTAQTRAYVLPKSVKWHPVPGLQNAYRLGVEVFNMGQTPAFSVEIITGTRLMPEENERGFDLHTGADNSQSTIASGSDVRAFSAPITIPQIDDINRRLANGSTYYFLGQISYIDVLNIKRYAKFRYMIQNRIDLQVSGLSVAPEGNDSN